MLESHRVESHRVGSGTSMLGSAVGSIQSAQLAPLPGVHSALAGVEASTQELAAVVSGLADRLERAGVLRPSAPRAAAANQQPTPPNFMCSLANSIDSQRVRVHDIMGAIADLQERIDL